MYQSCETLKSVSGSVLGFDPKWIFINSSGAGSKKSHKNNYKEKLFLSFY